MMADGDYERRGPRESELKRLKRIIESVKARRESLQSSSSNQKNML